MLILYSILTYLLAPVLTLALRIRLKKGKEDALRLNERMGKSSLTRPKGSLLWLHAASVGESQSALILITAIQKLHPDLSIMVTTGTLTSASLMQQRLEGRAFHQFYPLDHPLWAARFLDHWSPDLIFWIESEIWPNMLMAIKRRNIPCALINARLSDSSFQKWSHFKNTFQSLISVFDVILAQTKKDAERFDFFNHPRIHMTDNIKYSADPLPFDKKQYDNLYPVLENRIVWLYASTHQGEEELAINTHKQLIQKYPSLITIIVPRHPERRHDIRKALENENIPFIFRGQENNIPDEKTQIYIADTLGELGLFYRLCPIAMIGRSFSNDGGGGHNPIEPAQLDCAILTGSNYQFQKDLFDSMNEENAVIIIPEKKDLAPALSSLFDDKQKRDELSKNARNFAYKKNAVINTVMTFIAPILRRLP